MRSSKEKTKIIAFDLDDVLCRRNTDVGEVDKYLSCYPIQKMIDICNECYDNGYKIVVYTARGMTSFDGDIHDIYDNLYELTKDQLSKWGVKYHRLIMGKAHYDILIDDKTINSNRIKKKEDIIKFLENNKEALI
tara:strand:- start:51 stop:455 length:405 start_codon:yes stop_codon:yes gene_type:complete